MRRCLVLCVLWFACSVPALAGGDSWAQLRLGMSAAETSLLLGPPLFRTTNRGYDLWIYDCRAEVVFYRGPVIGWTAPTPNALSAAKSLASDLPLGGSPRLKATARLAPEARVLRQETSFRYRPRL